MLSIFPQSITWLRPPCSNVRLCLEEAIRSEIRILHLIVNIICIQVNLKNVQGTLFKINKIRKFTVFVGGGGGEDGGSGGLVGVKFESMRRKRATKIEHVQTRGMGGPGFGYFVTT